MKTEKPYLEILGNKDKMKDIVVRTKKEVYTYIEKVHLWGVVG